MIKKLRLMKFRYKKVATDEKVKYERPANIKLIDSPLRVSDKPVN